MAKKRNAKKTKGKRKRTAKKDKPKRPPNQYVPAIATLRCNFNATVSTFLVQRVLSPLRHGVTVERAFKEASCVTRILFLGADEPHSGGSAPHAHWMSEWFDSFGLIDLWHQDPKTCVPIAAFCEL